MATQILGKVGMLLRGDYNNATTYAKLDVVTYQGESYVAKTTTTGNLPTNTEYWQLLVEKPVKGTDYWTALEQAEMVQNVITGITPTLNQKADKSEIPDVSDFITKEVNNLTNYTLKSSTGSSIELSINNSTYVMTLNLKNSAGTTISTGTVDLPLETMVVDATYDNTNKKIVLTLKNGSTIDVPVADLVSGLQSEITNANKLSADLVDDTNQTNKFVTESEKSTWDGKQNTTDNNLATTNKNITSAINEVNSIAKGANQALSYASYSAMITAFSSASSTDYNVGQNIYIETLEVPDLWVYKVESTSSSYTYTTDSAIITALETTGYIQVGYYKISMLETQKVDLTDYVKNTDYASSSKAGVGKIGTTTGINISAAGVFYIASATSSEINAKTNSFKPIVPANLDYAVSNIVGHHVTLTQAQYDALQTKASDTYYYIVEE